jgi:hypothetical protein
LQQLERKDEWKDERKTDSEERHTIEIGNGSGGGGEFSAFDELLGSGFDSDDGEAGAGSLANCFSPSLAPLVRAQLAIAQSTRLAQSPTASLSPPIRAQFVIAQLTRLAHSPTASLPLPSETNSSSLHQLGSVSLAILCTS